MTLTGTIETDQRGFSGAYDIHLDEHNFASLTLRKFTFVQREGITSPTTGIPTDAVGLIMEGTLTVTKWGTVEKHIHVDPVTKAQFTPVQGAEAVLKFRVGNVRGNQAIVETVWNPELSGSILLGKGTTWSKRKDGTWIFHLDEGVVVPSK
jgi:hypothetical protein